MTVPGISIQEKQKSGSLNINVHNTFQNLARNNRLCQIEGKNNIHMDGQEPEQSSEQCSDALGAA
jgi:hypothetical protein